MATPGFQADLEALLLRAAAAEGPVGGADIGDARRFSFERFKKVYAELHISIVHHGVLLTRKQTRSNQKKRAADDCTARAMLQEQFRAIIHAMCRACGVADDGTNAGANNNATTMAASGTAASATAVSGTAANTSSAANTADAAAATLLRPLPLDGRRAPPPPARAVHAMYALYCLHQTQVLVPAETVRVTPFVLALLVRLERRLLLAHYTTPCGAAGVVTSMLDRECFQAAAYPGAAGYLSIDRFARVAGCGFDAVMRSAALDAAGHVHDDVNDGGGADDADAASLRDQPQLCDEAALHGGLLAPREAEEDDRLISELMDDGDDASYL